MSYSDPITHSELGEKGGGRAVHREPRSPSRPGELGNPALLTWEGRHAGAEPSQVTWVVAELNRGLWADAGHLAVHLTCAEGGPGAPARAGGGPGEQPSSRESVRAQRREKGDAGPRVETPARAPG